MKNYKIADFIIEYDGDSDYMNKRFDDFACEKAEKPDVTLKIVEKKPFFPRFLWD